MDPGVNTEHDDKEDAEEEARVAADLAYNAAKSTVYEREAETAMRNEIALRILTREIT